MRQPQSFCTFQLGKFYCGIAVHQVQEVLQDAGLTRVPLAPRDVLGLINLRGRIVTVIDLRRRMRLAPRESSPSGPHVIVQIGEECSSFLVDSMGDVRVIDAATLDPPPETMRSIPREMLHGVFRLPEQLLLSLDVGRLVDVRDDVDELSLHRRPTSGA